MKNIKLYTILALLGFFLYSCDNELDVAPILKSPYTANTTIEGLLSRHTPGSTDSYTDIDEGVIISGIVVSSDKEGNCYKFINIQDETGGIQIKVNNTALFNRYPIGQQVTVKCDGLVLGDYRKMKQLGWWANGSMEAITKEATYLFRDGAVKPEPTPITITTKSDIQEKHYGMLVKLNNCQFANPGSTYADVSASTSRDIILSDGNTVVLRTSNYATFAQNTLPSGTGSVVGILTKYNTTNQIVIRSLDDVDFRFKKEIASVNFNNNIFENGWNSELRIGETNWTYNSTANPRNVNISGKGIETDAWLISSAFDFSSYDNITMDIKHRVPSGSSENADKLKLYYTTSTSSSFSESDWTEIPGLSYPASLTSTSTELPAAVCKANVRFAFRYHDSSSTWIISEILFKTLVSE